MVREKSGNFIWPKVREKSGIFFYFMPKVRVFFSRMAQLTVEHILIHCAEYFHVRYQCFDVNNLGELFLTVSPNIIIHFIRRAGLLYLI